MPALPEPPGFCLPCSQLPGAQRELLQLVQTLVEAGYRPTHFQYATRLVGFPDEWYDEEDEEADQVDDACPFEELLAEGGPLVR